VNASSLNQFYEASASVAGALIGLLFVALSVAQARQSDAGGNPQKIRAGASLTAFTNALTVSLFTLASGQRSGTPATVVAITGLLFILAALISLRDRPGEIRDVLFLLTLLTALVAQLLVSLQVSSDPARLDHQQELAYLVVAFFLIGIARSWELIGGASIGIGHTLLNLLTESEPTDARADGERP
jgi:hypothetical protein